MRTSGVGSGSSTAPHLTRRSSPCQPATPSPTSVVSTTRVSTVRTICLPDDQAKQLVGSTPDVNTVVWDGAGEPPAGIDQVEFLVGAYGGPTMSPEALARMPRLSVIQLLSAGVEPWLPVVPHGVVLCNGRGIHGGPTADLAIAGMLAVLR